MTTYYRVELESGAKITVGFVRDGMKLLDEPAVDKRDRPLPDEPAPSAKAAVTRAENKATAKRTTKRAAAKKKAASPETPPTSDAATAGDAASTSEEDSQ